MAFVELLKLRATLNKRRASGSLLPSRRQSNSISCAGVSCDSFLMRLSAG
jgi:hypothetical protein